MEYIIRFNQTEYTALKSHLLSAGENETQAFALCSKADNLDKSIFICNKLILPDINELRNQSCSSIEPSKQHQSIVYGLAYELGLSVIDIHTHPFCKQPKFSSIDNYHGIQNAKYITENFPESHTMGMIVFGRNLECFDARIWNRKSSIFETVNRIEALGSPIDIMNNNINTEICYEDTYARHNIIPGWSQGLLENLKVLVCGLGGNGALVFQSLLSLGIGKNGWIIGCDPDILEISNLPRIPYASLKNAGRSKAALAKAYARYKAPELNVKCYKKSIEDETMLLLAKEANLLLGNVDKDGPRKILNSIAAHYLIPYIDLATEIIPEGHNYEAIGQVQTFIPGKTGCLICSGTIDPSEAALDFLSEEEKVEHARAGYIRGTNETPTPSVLHLNGVTSHLAISQLLRIIFGNELKGKEYLQYDRQKCHLITASINTNSDCPICGTKGYLGNGDKSLKEISKTNEKLEFRNGKIIRK